MMAEPEPLLSDEIEGILFPKPDESPEPAAAGEPETSEGESPPVDPEQPEPVEIPTTPDELAKKLGIDVSDVYNLKVPRANGREPMTLGELKDLEANADEVQQLRVKFEDEQAAFRSERLKFTQELQVLGGALQQAMQSGSPLDQETVQKAQQAWQTEVEQQNALARQIAPELANEATVERIEAEAAQYGAPKGFMSSGLPAWIQIRLARLSQLEQRIESAKAKQVKPTKTPSKPAASQPKPTKAQVRERVQNADDAGFADEVGKLLFGS